MSQTVTVTKRVEIPVKYLKATCGVRYWEDAEVNGKPEADDNPTIPCRQGDDWCPLIDLETGKIEGWPEGVTAKTHYKVCDDGHYWLLDDARRQVGKWWGHYVPDAFLCHGDRGYGDYIILTVGEDGIIAGWKRPSVDPAEWGG